MDLCYALFGIKDQVPGFITSFDLDSSQKVNRFEGRVLRFVNQLVST